MTTVRLTGVDAGVTVERRGPHVLVVMTARRDPVASLILNVVVADARKLVDALREAIGDE